MYFACNVPRLCVTPDYKFLSSEQFQFYYLISFEMFLFIRRHGKLSSIHLTALPNSFPAYFFCVQQHFYGAEICRLEDYFVIVSYKRMQKSVLSSQGRYSLKQIGLDVGNVFSAFFFSEFLTYKNINQSITLMAYFHCRIRIQIRIWTRIPNPMAT